MALEETKEKKDLILEQYKKKLDELMDRFRFTTPINDDKLSYEGSNA